MDGAYALYPDGRAESDPGQRARIEQTAAIHGLACRVHVPAGVWQGNEVEKRAAMFDLALEGATPERDWFIIVDGDQVVESVDAAALRAALADFSGDVATVRSRMQKDPTDFMPNRSLFRALPGLTVEKAHYNYTAARNGQPVYLWHPPPDAERAGALPETPLDLSRLMTIRHRSEPRPPGRMSARAQYYGARDRSRIER